jgi:imidazole glycerol phosphate synthase glutamine amidotransferase subunit
MIGIIDYGAGNVRSVGNALEQLQAPFFVSKKVSDLDKAQKLILPGVGEAQSAMKSLRRSGLVDWLKTVNVPFLGICIGMQILFDHSDERETPCLGLITGRVQRFDAGQVKIPHMGWNRASIRQANPLFHNIRLLSQNTGKIFLQPFKKTTILAYSFMPKNRGAPDFKC